MKAEGGGEGHRTGSRTSEVGSRRSEVGGRTVGGHRGGDGSAGASPSKNGPGIAGCSSGGRSSPGAYAPLSRLNPVRPRPRGRGSAALRPPGEGTAQPALRPPGEGTAQRRFALQGKVRLSGASPSSRTTGPTGRSAFPGGAECSTTDGAEATDGKCRPPIPSALSFQLSSLIPSRPPSAFSFHPSALRLQGRRPWMVWQMQPNSSSLRPG